MLVAFMLAVLVMHGVFAVVGVYARFPWMDNVTHASGGVWAAFVGYWLLTDARWRRRWGMPSRWLQYWAIIGMAAVVGIAWEILEYLVLRFSGATAEVLQFASTNVQDMVSDLTSDLVGAVIVVVMMVYARPRTRVPRPLPRKKSSKKRVRRIAVPLASVLPPEAIP